MFRRAREIVLRSHDRMRHSRGRFGSLATAPPAIFGEESMPKITSVVHHADRRTDVVMPYAPAIVVRRGSLVFLSGLTAAAVYHSHPHRDEEFDLPPTMREQAVLVMENLKTTLGAAGCTLGDVVAAT